MSRSYRKNTFATWIGYKNMKSWRRQESRRLRRCSKQVINSCDDFDSFIAPVREDFGSLWDSPIDGRKRLWREPRHDECKQRFYSRLGRFSSGFDGEHFSYCICYENKRGHYYWKLKRK